MRQPAAPRRRRRVQGRYGFYEAIDYTPARLPRGADQRGGALVHGAPPGMSLLSLAICCSTGPMQRRFGSDPAFQATELLLQERIPQRQPVFQHAAEIVQSAQRSGGAGDAVRIFTSAEHADAGSAAPLQRPVPRDGHQRGRRLQPLEGSRGHALARGRDPRQLGLVLLPARPGDRHCLVHLATSPRSRRAESYEAIFSQARAEFRRRDGDFDTHTEIAVSPEDDVELRRITHHQPLARAADDRVTSYAEVVLAPAAADAAHPAFSNLFVQTEILRDRAGDPVHAAPAVGGRTSRRWMFHLMAVHGAERRARCRTKPTGRNSSAAAVRVADPLALDDAWPLVGTARARCWTRSSRSGNRITIDAEQTATHRPGHRRCRDPRARASR